MSKSGSSSGASFTSLLTLAFIVLKLTSVINWSWWWVLSPLWIGFLLALPVVALIAYAEVKKEEREARKGRW